MKRQPELAILFGRDDVAFFRRIGEGAYLEENQTALAELSMAHEALSRLVEETAPDLGAKISRFEGASADLLLRELFPASDLSINGWRVEVRLLMPGASRFWVDRAFALSPAHPDLYVALGTAAENDLLAVRFLGWLAWEQVTSRPWDASDGSPVHEVSVTDLNTEWEALLAHLREEGAATLVLRPLGSHIIEEGNPAMVRKIECWLNAPQELSASEYEHWLACAVCQDWAIHELRYHRDAEKCVVAAKFLLADRQAAAALAEFERALALVPCHPESLFGRVHALWQMGNYLDALEASGEALRATVDPAPVHRARAALYHLLGRTRDAMEEIKELVRDQVEMLASLAGPLLPQLQPSPAWAYVPAARAGTPAEVVVIDARQPDQPVACRAEVPEVRPAEEESVLALYVHDLPTEFVGRPFRVLILSRGLQAQIEQELGRTGQAALSALFQPSLDPKWRLALLELALLRELEGLPVEGTVGSGGTIDLWESLPPLPPEALEAKTIIVYVFDPDLGEEGQ